MADHLRLTESWGPEPNDEGALRSYWLEGFEIIKQDIDMVRRDFNRCVRALGGSSAPELKDLKDGLKTARKTVTGALRTLEAPDHVNPYQWQADSYDDAAEQLEELAALCEALANFLRGVEGLPSAPG